MPNIHSLDDALSFWSNKFQSRELKAVFNLVSAMLANRSLDYNDLKDKNEAAYYVADYIRRIYSKVTTTIKDTGKDHGLCHKMSAKLDFDKSNHENIFTDFINSFSDKNNYQKCQIQVFLSKNDALIKKVLTDKGLKLSNISNKGFKNITSSLENKSDYSGFTCTDCAKIGDLVIGLISPNEMQLEHTDYSFDFIMKIINKPHRRLESETSILNNREIG